MQPESTAQPQLAGLNLVRSYKVKINYEEITNELGTKLILRSDGAYIPMDETNSDYQRYLNPEAEQSTPIVTEDE